MKAASLSKEAFLIYIKEAFLIYIIALTLPISFDIIVLKIIVEILRTAKGVFLFFLSM